MIERGHDLSSPHANKELVRRFAQEVVNQADPDAIERFVHPDYVEREPLPGQLPGREGLMRWYRDYLAAFPDLHWTLEEQVAERDRVVSRFTMVGTHRGEFLDVPGTGREVRVAIMLLQRMTEGKIIEGYTFPDGLAAFRQLGLISSQREPPSD